MSDWEGPTSESSPFVGISKTSYPAWETTERPGVYRLDLASLGAEAGQQSEAHDFGIGARPYRFILTPVAREWLNPDADLVGLEVEACERAEARILRDHGEAIGLNEPEHVILGCR